MSQAKRIIGIDPGLGKTGVGIIDFAANKFTFVASQLIKTEAKAPLADRLLVIHEGLLSILNEFTPVSGAIENTYINAGSDSSLKLAHARAAAMLTMRMYGAKVHEYQANTIKKTITGYGLADKSQMVRMVNFFLPKAKVSNPDQADALAIAICHAYYL